MQKLRQLLLPWLHKLVQPDQLEQPNQLGQGVTSIQLSLPRLHTDRIATVTSLPCQQLRGLVITGTISPRFLHLQASVALCIPEGGCLLPEAACSMLTKLVLQGVGVPQAAGQRFLAAISSFTCLQHLGLHLIAGASGSELLGCLQQLTGLNIPHC
jgi:hypothetical protein